MTLIVKIAGIDVLALVDSIKIADKEQFRSTCSLAVRDDTGTANYTQNMTVVITDGTTLFSGYIDSASPNVPSTNTLKTWALICKDKRYLADKRQVLLTDFTGPLAGDVVTDLHRNYLAAEGVTANYQLDHDNTAATLGAGTLTRTSAANGALQLSLAGSTYTKTETTTSDFSTGTLDNLQATNNTLQLASTPAMKLTGAAAPNIQTNPFLYIMFKNNINITLNAGDRLCYDIFVSSTSPVISGGVDCICTDGTNFRDQSIGDQNGVAIHPANDISTYAKDKWYSRTFSITNPNTTVLVGKTVSYASMVLEGDAEGIYTIYVRNVTIQTSAGAVRATLFDASLSKNQLVNVTAFYGFKLSLVTAYSEIGTRTSPAYSYSGVGIVKNSIISWSQLPYVQNTSNASSYLPPILVETSIDGGATWQVCTNHGSITNLLAGSNASGRSVTVKQILSLAGPNPEITPVFSDCSFSISPSYAATKSDAIDSDGAATDFATGTINNLSYNTTIGGEVITGAYDGWRTGDATNQANGSVTGQTTFGTPGGNPIVSLLLGQCALREGYPTTPNFIASRFDWAGQWQNFVIEVDVLVPALPFTTYPNIVYRTTGWQNTDNTWAYTIQITGANIVLYKGTNTSSGAGGATALQTSNAINFVVGQYYHFTVIVNGNSHLVYINNILYLSVTDSTWPGAGYVGLRMWNGNVTRQTVFFMNFGITSLAGYGTRMHPALNLNALASVENSVIQWDENKPANTDIIVEASLDGGATYTECTNGAAIPILSPGTNVAGKYLTIRETLSAQNANTTPVLYGISAIVLGNYSTSGTRISTALSIGSVGRVGSSSIAWLEDIPPSTSLTIDESLVASSGPWTTVSNGASIPTITSQPASVYDSFALATGANYTSANYGASNGTWALDTANSRLQGVTGASALYIWNQLTAKDMQIDAVVSQAENAGLVWRYTNASTFYLMVIADNSAVSGTSTVRLYRRVAGVTTGVLATGVINFPRGTYHTVRVAMLGSAITVSFDGVQVLTLTDATITASGSIGFMQNSTTVTNWYSVRGQQYGDDVTGKSVWTRTTLTSTDPTATPSLLDIATSVRGQNLMNGLVIGQTAYQYAQSVASAMDDVTKRSATYTWGITYQNALIFQSQQANPADWVLTTSDIQWSSPITLVNQSPLYRNKQVVIGGIDTVLIPDTRKGDGFTQTWTLAYPVDSIKSIMVNGQAATYGVQGKDVGVQFSYAVGTMAITQDTSYLPPSKDDSFTFNYYGQIPVVKTAQDLVQQGILTGLDGSSGIVEVVESIPGLNAVTTQAIADARIAQYAILSQDWSFTTLKGGLQAGKLLTVFVPEYKLNDIRFFITEVDTTIKLSPTGVFYIYDVKCTTGANSDNWAQVLGG